MAEPSDNIKPMKLGEFRQFGHKVYLRCLGCGKIVRVNKPLIGSFHLCAEEPRKTPK